MEEKLEFYSIQDAQDIMNEVDEELDALWFRLENEELSEEERQNILEKISQLNDTYSQANHYVLEAEELKRTRNFWIKIALAAAILATGITLVKNYNSSTATNTSTEKTSTVLPPKDQEVDKDAVIAEISELLDEYGTNPKGNAEAVYAYFANEPMTMDEYTYSVGVTTDLLINSYRNGDTSAIDLAIASQSTPEAKEELTAAKSFIEPYITNPNVPNATKWVIGSKLTINDGILYDFRSVNSGVHEVAVLLFNYVGPVLAENNDLNKKYDEKKLAEDHQELVSKIPLAIDGPVWVKFKTVLKEINKEYDRTVKARAASDVIIKTETSEDCDDKARQRTK